jgi:hypothetical protein
MAESSLTGFLLKQAFKSRDEAKAEKARQDKVVESDKKIDDKDRKGLFRKAFTKNVLSGLFGGKSATGGGSSTAIGAMLGGGKKKKQKQPKDGGGKSSGGKAKGLEKILLIGFGSLAADTTTIGGGLAALTEIMNSQLNVESDISSNIQGINAILADQLEVQTSFLDAIGLGGGLGGGGGGEGGLSSLFGGAGAGSTTNESSLTGLLLEQFNKLKDLAMSFGGGAALQAARQAGMKGLARAGAAAAPAASVLGVGALLSAGGEGMFQLGKTGDQSLKDRSKLIKEKEARGENTFLDKTLQYGQTGLGEIGKTVGVAADVGGAPVRMLGELIANPFLNEKQKKEQAMNLAKYDTRIREHARGWMNRIDFLNVISDEKGGFGNIYGNQAATKEMAGKMAAGGSKAMIGEAGKEAVVPLHSADSPAKSKIGMDPSMQASAGSMLAVTDQFIKSMGPLGGSVSQALGSDISNLAKTFGMSQTLPNLSLGGDKFREDTTAKKDREKFLKELIAGSLEALGAKSKPQSQSQPESPSIKPTLNKPSPPETRNPVSNPDPNSPNPPSNGSNGKAMGARYTDPGSQPGAVIPNLSKEEAKNMGLGNKKDNQKYIEFQPGSKLRDKYHILLNAANGSYEVWEKPGIFNWAPKRIFLGQKQNSNVVENSAIAEEAHNSVKKFMIDNMPKTGQALKWLSSDDILGGYGGPNNEKGGSVKSFQQGGKVVQKPWWDFLGWVTGLQEVQKGTTGIYSNSPAGRIAEASAQRNRMMKELGYESGGILTGVKASASTPKVAPVSYAPMATAEIESTDIGAIVNIIGSQTQQAIPVMSDNKGPTTSDYVAAPTGGGLAFTVLSSSQWGG